MQTRELTTTPDADAFRALARSSPWRWRTLRFVRRTSWPPVDDRDERPVRAWLRRPHQLRVEDLDGTRRTSSTSTAPPAGAWLMPDGRPVTDEHIDKDDSAGRTVLYRRAMPEEPVDLVDAVPARPTRPGGGNDGANGVPPATPVDADRQPRPWTFGDSDLPPLRADGLVAERTANDTDFDAPLYGGYQWVAMLDPVELAEGDHAERGREPGALVHDVVEVVHHGRRAWQAELVATDAYRPRCACCPLLLHTATDLPPPAGVALADSHVVRLDVRTGVCVSVLQLGGTHHGWELDVAIEAVDRPMDASLFT